MRALTFILTLLIGFQPSAWAMSSNAPPIPGKYLQVVSGIDSQHASKVRVSKKNSHVCLDTAGLTNHSGTSNCLSDCTGYCAPSLFLQRPPFTHNQGKVSIIAYQTPIPGSFVSLTDSPEIHPPRTGIHFD